MIYNDRPAGEFGLALAMHVISNMTKRLNVRLLQVHEWQTPGSPWDASLSAIWCPRSML